MTHYNNALTSPTRILRNAWLAALSFSLLLFTVAGAAPGDLDPSFDGDGRVTTEIVPGQWNWAAGVAVQSTGSIVVVGNTYVPNSPQNIGLVRYTTEGALDPSFSADRKVVTNLGGIDQGLAVAVQANDKIVVAGQKCNNAGTTCDVAVLRYNSNGTLDKTFSGDGKQIDDFGGADNGSTGGLALQPNGKIIVGGYMFDKAAGNYDFAVYRYTGAGVLDPTFSKDGRVNIGFGTGWQDSVYEVAIQPDGKIVAVGESCDANYENCDFALARLNLNGTLDKTFSGDGKQTLNFGADDSALGVAVQPDGKIVVVGGKFAATTAYFAVARYNPDGTLDKLFGGKGFKLTNFSGNNAADFANDVIVQPDGNIVVAGSVYNATRDFALIRFTATGAVDKTFSGDGKVTIDFGLDELLNAVALQADGSYLLAGQSFNDWEKDFAVARVLP